MSIPPRRRVLFHGRDCKNEYDASLDDALWRKTHGKVATDKLWNAITMRSGRDALKVIAREFSHAMVLLPALSCDSMSLPFKMYGHDVCYYRLTEKYEIDVEYLLGVLMKTDITVLFLYMDYFGNCVADDAFFYEIKVRFQNVIFIKDRTHM